MAEFPGQVVRVPRYEGSLTAALRYLGENLCFAIDCWLRNLGGDPETFPAVKCYRDLPYKELSEKFNARIEADRQMPIIQDEQERNNRAENLSNDLHALVLSVLHAEKRKGAPRKHAARDARLWKRYRLEQAGSYAQIGLREEPKMTGHAVAAAIKRMDAEADEFKNLVSSLKEPLRALGLELIEDTCPDQSVIPEI